jgi:pimeloyl-ACP methyl ester carboxylesterase
MTILTYCQLFNQALPTKIAGLILINTTYTNPVRTSILSGLLTSLQKTRPYPFAAPDDCLCPGSAIAQLDKYYNGSMYLNNHLIGFGGSETRGQLELATYLTTTSPVGVIGRGVLAMFDYEATPVLASIAIPVLIIAADKDKLTKPEASVFMARSIPERN